MKRAKRTLVILGLALASCRGPIFTPTATPQVVHVRLWATTAAAPLLQDALAAYRPPHTVPLVESVAPNWATVQQHLLLGDVPFALSSYAPQRAHLWVAPLGWDGIAIVVHTSNDVPALTLAQVRRLFQGQIQSWDELGGPALAVTVVSREQGSGTRRNFEAQVMGEARITWGARLALSSEGVLAIVRSTPGAVGYVSMAYLGEGVRAVPLRRHPDDAPQPLTAQTVSAGLYPLRAPLLIVGLRPPAAGSFYEGWFAWLQSAEGQRVVARRYAPLRPLAQEADASARAPTP